MKATSPSTRCSIKRDARPRRTVESSIDVAIPRNARRAKPGTVVTPALFAGLGGRAAVDKTLQRLVARDELRRLSRGLYDKPRYEPWPGTAWPSVDAVVAAPTGKDRLRLQPTGAQTTDLLGLSDQLLARVEFLTDGASRTVKSGQMQIVLKRTTPRQMAAAGRTSGLVTHALRSLGHEHMTPQRLEKLMRSVQATERRTSLEDLSLAPGWMQPTLRALAGHPLTADQRGHLCRRAEGARQRARRQAEGGRPEGRLRWRRMPAGAPSRAGQSRESRRSGCRRPENV